MQPISAHARRVLAFAAAITLAACDGDVRVRVGQAGEACSSSAQCLPGHQCRDGFCRASCGVEAPCPTGLACTEGACLSRTWAYGAFGDFGPCSSTCGDGVETRTRECVGADGAPGPCDACGGQCVEERACVGSISCVYGPWEPVGSCGASCEAPSQQYQRGCERPDGGGFVDCALCGGDCVKSDVCACASCGDSVVQSGIGEVCDTGAARSDQSCNGCCRTDCHPQRCGDDIVDSAAAETCDDGPTNSNEPCADCCRSTCTRQRCGDGIIDAPKGETCDNGTNNRNTSCQDCCRTTCLLQRCGDSIIDSADGETCDRGASNSDAPCTSFGCCRTTCVAPRCGDGVTDPYLSETCDDGTASNTNAPCSGCCRTDCTQQRCGDGLIDADAGENCDDMNSENYDGCSACRRTEMVFTGDQPGLGMSSGGVLALTWYSSVSARVQGRWLAPDPATTAAISFEVNTGSFGAGSALGMAPSGRIVLTWPVDGDSQGVRYVRMPLNGTAPGSTQFISTTSAGANRVAASMQANESFVLAWERGNTGSRDVLVNPFDLNGGSLGSSSTTVDASADEQFVDVAVDNLGRAIVVWAEPDGSGNGIFAHCLDATSSNTATRVTSSDVAVNQTVSGEQRRPRVAIQRGSGTASRAVVVWRNDPGQNIIMRRMNVDSDSCEPIGSDQLVTPTSSATDWPAVAMDQDGDFVVAWAENGVYAQRFDADAVALWTQPLRLNVINFGTAANDLVIALDPAGSGRFAVGWSISSAYVLLQRVDGAGALVNDGAW